MMRTSPSRQSKRIDQVCDLGRGRVISQEEIRRHSGVYPVYSSQSKDDGVFGHLDTFDFEGDYVTWTTDGANAGTVFFRTGRFNCTNVCGTLKPKSSDTSARYLARALSPVTKRHVSYVGNPKLMNNVMAAIEVGMPSRPEQDFVAAVLDTVDEAIAKTEAVITKLRQVRAGLLHDLLTRGLDQHGQLRDPIAHPEQFQDSPLGRIPREWDVKAMESCVASEITYGIVQAGPHVEGGVPYVRTGDMTGDRLVVDQMLRTSPETAARFRRSRVEAGEIVCAIRATVGKVLPVPQELDGANLTQGTARIAPKAQIDPCYLLWAIRSDKTQREIALEAKGTTFFEITLKDLRRVRVSIPSRREEQERIAAVIQGLEGRLSNEVNGLSKLQQLRSGLMTDLLTGRVRVPPADYKMSNAAPT